MQAAARWMLERGCGMPGVPQTWAPGPTGARGTDRDSEDHPLPAQDKTRELIFGFRLVAKSDP